MMSEWHQNFYSYSGGVEANIDSMIQLNLKMLESSFHYNKPPADNRAYSSHNVASTQSHNVALNQSYQNNTIQPEIELIGEIQNLSLNQRRKAVEKSKPNWNWITPKQCVEDHSDLLTPFERNEILHYSQVFFIGHEVVDKKILGVLPMENNFGYDDIEGGYIPVKRDHVAYRYEILKVLGKGAFGLVLKVFDHKNMEYAALKMTRNDDRFLQTTRREVRILEDLQREDQAKRYIKERSKQTIGLA